MASWQQQALAWGSMVGFGWLLSRKQPTVGLEAEAWTNAPADRMVSTCQDFKDSLIGKKAWHDSAGYEYIEKFHPKLDATALNKLGLNEQPEWATIQIQRYGGYGGASSNYSYTAPGTPFDPSLTIGDYTIRLTMREWIMGEKLMGGATKNARTPKSVMKKLNDKVDEISDTLENEPEILGNPRLRYELEKKVRAVWVAVEQLLSVHHFRDSFPKISCATYQKEWSSDKVEYYLKIPDATAVADCISANNRKSYKHTLNTIIVIRRDTPLPSIGALLRVLMEINSIQMKVIRRQGDEERNAAVKDAAQEVVTLSGNWFDNEIEDADEFSEDSIEQTLEAIRRYIKDRVKKASPYDPLTDEGGLWWH